MLHRVRVIQTAINCETLQENVEHVLPQRDCRNKLLGNYVVSLFFKMPCIGFHTLIRLLFDHSLLSMSFWFHVTSVLPSISEETHLKSLAALQRSPLFWKRGARFAGTSEITPVIQMI